MKQFGDKEREITPVSYTNTLIKSEFSVKIHWTFAKFHTAHRKHFFTVKPILYGRKSCPSGEGQDAFLFKLNQLGLIRCNRETAGVFLTGQDALA